MDDPRLGLLRFLRSLAFENGPNGPFSLQQFDVFKGLLMNQSFNEHFQPTLVDVKEEFTPLINVLMQHDPMLAYTASQLLQLLEMIQLSENCSKDNRLGAQMWITLLCRTAITKKLPTSQQDDIVWEGVLVNFNQEVLQCSFWRSLENRNNPFVLIMGKAAPQRCQIREGGETILSKFETHPQFAHAFWQWMDCTLFGLYRYSRERDVVYLTPQRQLEFFELTQDHEKYVLFHWWLCKRQDLLCIFFTREYLAYLVPLQPGLLHVLQHTFNWAEFVRISNKVGNDVRQLINRHGWCALFSSFSTELSSELLSEFESDSEDSDSEEEDLKPTKKNSKKRPSRAKTQKPKKKSKTEDLNDSKEEDLPEEFVFEKDGSKNLKNHEKLRNILEKLQPIYKEHRTHKAIPHSYAGMIRLILQDPSRRVQYLNSLSKKKVQQDLQCCILGQQEMQKHFYQRHQQDFLSLVFASRNKVPPASLAPIHTLSPDEHFNEHGITAKHFSEMEAWINRCVDYDEDKALQILRSFGASVVGFEAILKLKRAHESKQGKKVIVNGLLQLAIHHQYTYSLLHSFAFLWNRFASFRLHRLPLHYVENQIRAIRKRWCLQENDPIPDIACVLKICKVCDHIFSLTNNDKTRLKASDSFGYNYVAVDLATGDEYCSRKKVIAHQTIKDVQLTGVWGLGQAITWDKQLILMCPRCSLFFVYSERCLYLREFGFVCSACTIEVGGPEAAAKFPVQPKRKQKKVKLNHLAVSF